MMMVVSAGLITTLVREMLTIAGKDGHNRRLTVSHSKVINPAPSNLVNALYLACRPTPIAFNSPFDTSKVQRLVTTWRRQMYSATTSSLPPGFVCSTRCSHQMGQPIVRPSNGTLSEGVRRLPIGSSVLTSIVLP
jgi:hypothetical protein